MRLIIFICLFKKSNNQVNIGDMYIESIAITAITITNSTIVNPNKDLRL